jgi:hypothetical protein
MAMLNELRQNSKGEFDIEMQKNLLVLHFIHGESGKTERCAFCGRNHFHGKGEGHRLPHCSWNILNQEIRDRIMSFQNSRGQTFCLDSGYILRRNDDHNF